MQRYDKAINILPLVHALLNRSHPLIVSFAVARHVGYFCTLGPAAEHAEGWKETRATRRGRKMFTAVAMATASQNPLSSATKSTCCSNNLEKKNCMYGHCALSNCLTHFFSTFVLGCFIVAKVCNVTRTKL